MGTAAITVEPDNVPTFVRHLVGAGHEVVHTNGPEGTIMLLIETEDPQAMGVIVQAASDECDRGTMQ